MASEEDITSINRATYILIGTHGGQKPLCRTRPKWEDNIILELKKVRCEDVEWIQVAYRTHSLALVSRVMNFYFL